MLHLWEKLKILAVCRGERECEWDFCSLDVNVHFKIKLLWIL